MNLQFVWPYDEVALRPADADSGILVDSPWLKAAVSFEKDQDARARRLAEKFQGDGLSTGDFAEVQWLFGALSKYPVSYLLPRAQWPDSNDRFDLADDKLVGKTPREFAAAALGQSRDLSAVLEDPTFHADWKWDALAAIRFSASAPGIDPATLFSVARRYHLLSATENEGTQALFARLRSLSGQSEVFRDACALMVRQNHYVTERCHGALAPALELAKSARAGVLEFIAAEQGHDRILAASLRALGREPNALPVLSHTRILMDLFQAAASRNFLAFAIIVDFFERSSYQDSDPMAQVLQTGGLAKAAAFIDRHREINDAGEHENVALGFLDRMGPLSADYAIEALRFAEATTNVMSRLPHAVLQATSASSAEAVL